MKKIEELKKGWLVTSAKLNHIIRNLNELQERVERLENKVAKMPPVEMEVERERGSRRR